MLDIYFWTDLAVVLVSKVWFCITGNVPSSSSVVVILAKKIHLTTSIIVEIQDGWKECNTTCHTSGAMNEWEGTQSCHWSLRCRTQWLRTVLTYNFQPQSPQVEVPAAWQAAPQLPSFPGKRPCSSKSSSDSTSDLNSSWWAGLGDWPTVGNRRRPPAPAWCCPSADGWLRSGKAGPAAWLVFGLDSRLEGSIWMSEG